MENFNEFMKDGWSYPKNNCGGSVDPEVVEQSVNKYFEKNPPSAVDESQIRSVVNSYVQENISSFKGEKGDPGQNGAPGEKGDPGQDGAPGHDGAPGQDGAPGADGITPHIGENGNWFIGDRDTGQSSTGDLSGIQREIERQSSEIEEVKAKVGQAVANTIDTPFTTAYWKDSNTNKIYLVKVVDGVLTVTENVGGNEEDISGLEDLLPDRLLIWHDEFDGDSLDETKWSIGNCWGEKDSRDDDPINSCYQLSNSVLRLCARPSNNNDITQKWYSSAIISKMKLRKGHVQARIRIKSNKYTNNAYWLNAPDPWPVSGEIDMIETSGDTKFEGALHYGKSDGSNGAHSAGTYPSTTDWFIAGIEIEDDVLKLYVNNEYHKDMDSNMASKFVNWFTGVNPFANNPKSCIFDIAITKPSSHLDGDWESYIDIDYVRFYAPISSEDALNVKNPKEITDFDIITLGNNVREVYFMDNGVKKLQAHAKFMLNIRTTPHTELTGYKASSDNTDVLTACSKYDAVGFYSGKNGNANLTITHSASGLSKVLSLEVAQNMNDKVSCEDYTLGVDNIGQEKFWIANLSSTVINKMITNGKFKAKGNTTYKLNVSGGAYSYAYNSTFRNIVMIEYDSSGNKLATTAFSSKDGTITTNENTTHVQLSANYTDGSNFARRDYFDMLANLTCINIVESGSEVEVVECTGITLDQTEITLDESTESVTLIATISPEDCTQEVTWISQQGFCSVNNGLVKGIALGTDTIIANCGNQSASCQINVIALSDITTDNNYRALFARDYSADTSVENDYSVKVENGLATLLRLCTPNEELYRYVRFGIQIHEEPNPTLWNGGIKIPVGHTDSNTYLIKGTVNADGKIGYYGNGGQSPNINYEYSSDDIQPNDILIWDYDFTNIANPISKDNKGTFNCNLYKIRDGVMTNIVSGNVNNVLKINCSTKLSMFEINSGTSGKQLYHCLGLELSNTPLEEITVDYYNKE